MAVELIVDLEGGPMSWSEFQKKTPPYSIAIDGYVDWGPVIDKRAPRANLNHHGRVNRLATRSTCAQAQMFIRKGLFKLFRNDDGPMVKVYVLDCDQDICLTWFQLNNPHLAKPVMNPILNRVVHMEDMLDATCGTYAYPTELESVKELAWTFEPYSIFRLGGGIERGNPDEFRGIITDVENRIMNLVNGKGKPIDLDTRYEVIGGGPRWSMVKEIGAQARLAMANDGIEVFLSVREREDGRWAYIICLIEEMLDVRLHQMANYFNKLEGCKKLRWGGADNIIGSPQLIGSTLSPDIISEAMNREMSRLK